MRRLEQATCTTRVTSLLLTAFLRRIVEERFGPIGHVIGPPHLPPRMVDGIASRPASRHTDGDV